jgi:hypothetical protein
MQIEIEDVHNVQAYVIKVKLKNTISPVWRKIVIPAGISFDTLDKIIMIVMEWSGDHLSEFRIKDRDVRIKTSRYTQTTNIDAFFRGKAAVTVECVDTILLRGDHVEYIYDFGASWLHDIKAEKVLENYTAGHAEVIGYKGDNFDEDEYDDDEEIEEAPPFDIKSTNASLAKMKYKFVDEARRASEMKRYHSHMDMAELTKSLQRSVRKVTSALDACEKEEKRILREALDAEKKILKAEQEKLITEQEKLNEKLKLKDNEITPSGEQLSFDDL